MNVLLVGYLNCYCIHTVEKPFGCDMCNNNVIYCINYYVFDLESTLIQHISFYSTLFFLFIMYYFVMFYILPVFTVDPWNVK
jgi:hypothetical protein